LKGTKVPLNIKASPVKAVNMTSITKWPSSLTFMRFWCYNTRRFLPKFPRSVGSWPKPITCRGGFHQLPTKGNIMSETKKPFANNQQQMLAARVEWEINQMIFPHVKQQADYGYPFESIDEMLKEHVYNRMVAMINLDAIGSAAAKMQSEYGDAFQHIAFREISHLINAFLELAEQRVQTHPRKADTTAASV
jgi:hypothetical protein